MRDGIIKRGSTWSYVVRELDLRTGRTKARWVGGFQTQRAAKAARDEARRAVARGSWVAPASITVAAWLDRWIEAHAVELKPSTVKSYRDNITRYLEPALGHHRLQALTPSMISAALKDLHESGGQEGKPLSARTIEFARAVLRKALQDAVLDRILEVNPVIGTKRPRVVKSTHHHVDRKSAQILSRWPGGGRPLGRPVDARRVHGHATGRVAGAPMDGCRP